MNAAAMPHHWQAEYRHGPGRLRQLQQESAHFLDLHEISGRTRYRTELALEEWVTNVVRHGFGNEPGAALQIEIVIEPAAVLLRFTDAGPAFDPTTRRPPTVPASLAEAEPGGLGLAMIADAAASTRYRRDDGLNHLELTILRGSQA